MRDQIETTAIKIWEFDYSPNVQSGFQWKDARPDVQDHYRKMAKIAVRTLTGPNEDGVFLESVANNLKQCGCALGEIRDQLDELIQINLDNEPEETSSGPADPVGEHIEK